VTTLPDASARLSSKCARIYSNRLLSLTTFILILRSLRSKRRAQAFNRSRYFILSLSKDVQGFEELLRKISEERVKAMQVFLILVLIISTVNLSGSQSKNDAQACMEIFAMQMNRDVHNKKIGSILQPFTTEEESTRVNSRFKDMCLNFSQDVLKKMEKSFNERDFYRGWAHMNADMKKSLARYYRESALVMDQAKQRAIIKIPEFAKQKDCALIEKMIASCNLTAKMLEISTKLLKHPEQAIELATLTTLS
jgi:hypothetical protein